MNALLVVSHSAEAARGIVAIASQMGGDGVVLAACGGAADGSLGNSVPSIVGVLENLLDQAEGVVAIPDLGSSVLAVQMARELLGERAARVRIADGPVLEGALMAAVEAGIGSSLDRIVEVVNDTRYLKKIEE